MKFTNLVANVMDFLECQDLNRENARKEQRRKRELATAFEPINKLKGPTIASR